MLRFMWDHLKRTLTNEKGILPALAFLANPAFWSGVGGAASAGGALAGLFGKKEKGGETVNLEQLMPSFQRETGQNLSNWIKKYMNNYVPGEDYSGKLSAGMSGQEGAGISLLDRFLGGEGIGDLFKQGKRQISDTLSGMYADPNASPFVRAMKDVSNQDLEDAINASRRGAGARGKFFSTAALGEERDLRTRNLQNINQIVGQFLQNERQNMLNAVPMGSAMDQYEMSTLPLQKIQASQTFGSLSRTLEQADLERGYNDYLRKRTEAAQPITAAQSLYGTKSEFGVPSWQMPKTQEDNSLGSIMKLLGGLNFDAMSGSGDIWSKLGGLFKKAS